MDAEHTDAPRWALWRQNDNGNRELMRRFADRADANREMRGYEVRGHKQTCWIEPAE
jgi:hypothetical protein